VQWDGGELVLGATDLTRFAACRHLTRLDREHALGLRAGPDAPTVELELLWSRGIGHERTHLQRLRARGLTVREIPDPSSPSGDRNWSAAEQLTVEAMAAGVDVVHQGVFVDGAWRGRADFLIRRDDRSGHWPWAYDVADTKLARRVSVSALLQMAVYAERLAVLQGIAPERLTVVTGDGGERSHPFAECAAYARATKAELQAFLRDLPPTTPEPVAQCGRCAWSAQCRRDREDADHLSLVAGMRSGYAALLREAGIDTVAALAAAAPSDLPAALPPALAARLHGQARLQVESRPGGLLRHRALATDPGRGLALLPAPSPGDLFFDIEGDPYVGGHGLEYLFGLSDVTDRYTAFWALESTQQKGAFEALVDHLMAAWRRDPGMHVYHYAPYERLRLQSLSARHGTRGAEVDRLLRGGRLIDLYAVVKQGVQVGTPSYSLKKLEPLYWDHARDGEAISDALGSVVAFETWLADGGDHLLDGIRSYNEQDCRSTRALRDWLEAVREEVGGDAVVARPPLRDGEPSAAVAAATERAEELRARLLATLPVDAWPEDAVRTPEQQAVWLLAMLVDWHRREAQPQWWDWFRRKAMTAEELIADPTALAGLTDPEAVGRVERSTLWRLRFPVQESGLGPGETRWEDAATGRRVRIGDVRPDEGWLTLLQDRDAGAPTVTALVPSRPVAAPELVRGLADLAEHVLAKGISSPDPAWRAARDLVLRRTEPTDRRPGESVIEAVVRAGTSLDGGVLAVQGPPGTGKTRAAVELVLALIGTGRRVGVCAFSHTVIGNLLDQLVGGAAERGRPLCVVQKAHPEQACPASAVERVGSTAEVVVRLADDGPVPPPRRVDVVAGTPWLFGAEAMAGQLDVVIVDEAGQLSLANVLALSRAARGLVLFGDPQQLTQPISGQHPRGAGASALGHLLGGAATLDPQVGLLLDAGFRMHPEICRFVSRRSYDGRLVAAAGRGEQRVESAGPLHGAGLRWVPVVHQGHATGCPPEAEAVADLVAAVLADGWWTDHEGQRHRLLPEQVMVLAPFHRQLHLIRRAVRARGFEVPVGTVDAFQGREAVVVLYSLTSSTLTDSPRGPDFLLDAHRWTVALSRARAMVAVVGSPALLTSAVTNPARLRLVDALCAYAEQAERVDLGQAEAPGGESAADPAPGSAGSLQVTVRPCRSPNRTR